MRLCIAYRSLGSHPYSRKRGPRCSNPLIPAVAMKPEFSALRQLRAVAQRRGLAEAALDPPAAGLWDVVLISPLNMAAGRLDGPML